MPKIGKYSFMLNGQLTLSEIFYTREKGFHFKKIDGLVAAMNKSVQFHNGHSSEQGLIDSFTLKKQEYHEKIKTKKKVIRIVTAVGRSLVWVPHPSGSGMTKANEELGSLSGYSHGLGLGWDVLWRVEHNGSKLHHIGPNDEVYAEFHPRGFSSGADPAVIEVDYQPDYITFLEDMAKLLANMSMRFHDFFKRDDLEAMMQSLQLPLPKIE